MAEVAGYVLDSWAMLALVLAEEPAASAVRSLLEDADAGRVLLHASIINVGEVVYTIARRRSWPVAVIARDRLLASPIRIHRPADTEVWAAARLKSEHRIAYADAFAAERALALDSALVTGDPEFRALEVSAGLRLHWLTRAR